MEARRTIFWVCALALAIRRIQDLKTIACWWIPALTIARCDV
jgi:hypothetical protein